MGETLQVEKELSDDRLWETKVDGRSERTLADVQQVSLSPSVRYFLPTDLSSVEDTLSSSRRNRSASSSSLRLVSELSVQRGTNRTTTSEFPRSEDGEPEGIELDGKIWGGCQRPAKEESERLRRNRGSHGDPAYSPPTLTFLLLSNHISLSPNACSVVK